MKKLSILILFGLITGASFSASAAIMDSLTQLSEKGAQYFCRKGSASDFTYSIRSGSGLACKSKIGAALAVYACLDGNFEEFKESKCFKNAQETLGEEVIIKDENDEIDTAKTVANAKAVVLKEGTSAGGSIFNLIKSLIK